MLLFSVLRCSLKISQKKLFQSFVSSRKGTIFASAFKAVRLTAVRRKKSKNKSQKIWLYQKNVLLLQSFRFCGIAEKERDRSLSKIGQEQKKTIAQSWIGSATQA